MITSIGTFTRTISYKKQQEVAELMGSMVEHYVVHAPGSLSQNMFVII